MQVKMMARGRKRIVLSVLPKGERLRKTESNHLKPCPLKHSWMFILGSSNKVKVLFEHAWTFFADITVTNKRGGNPISCYTAVFLTMIMKNSQPHSALTLPPTKNFS